MRRRPIMTALACLMIVSVVINWGSDEVFSWLFPLVWVILWLIYLSGVTDRFLHPPRPAAGPEES